MANPHDQPLWPTHMAHPQGLPSRPTQMANSHGQPSWQTLKAYSHDQPSCSTLMANPHGQPTRPPTLMANSYSQSTRPTLIANPPADTHNQPSWPTSWPTRMTMRVGHEGHDPSTHPGEPPLSIRRHQLCARFTAHGRNYPHTAITKQFSNIRRHE